MLKLTVEREQRGWSKAKLARRARLDQATVSRIESGRLRPYRRELERLARALDVPKANAETLLEEVCEPKPLDAA